MDRIFKISWPDDCGPMWMNVDNLMLCINAYCENKDGRITAEDVTNEVVTQGQLQAKANLLGDLGTIRAISRCEHYRHNPEEVLREIHEIVCSLLEND